MTTITLVTFNKFAELASEGREGIVLLGTGGDLTQWTEGVHRSIRDAEAGELNASEAFVATTSGLRTDMLMLLPDKGINMGRLVMWRLQFGECSWLSDYVVNYIDQHSDVDHKWVEKYQPVEDWDDDEDY